MYLYRTDVGIDNIWCKRAHEYRKQFSLLENINETDRNCAIYININNTIVHLNWGEANPKKPSLTRSFQYNYMLEFVLKTFKNLFVDISNSTFIDEQTYLDMINSKETIPLIQNLNEGLLSLLYILLLLLYYYYYSIHHYISISLYIIFRIQLLLI